jgi:adsorption protein B
MFADFQGLAQALDGVSLLWATLNGLLAMLAVIYLVFGIDDLVYDAYYWLRALRRATLDRKKIRPVPREALAMRPEQALAILVPAWDESAVLEPMLARLNRTIQYQRYRVYVGVYPNDAATRAAAERARDADPNVRVVVLDHDGPTNKADCLNGIWRALRSDEENQRERFEIFVMQDCEDVIHPLAWQLFNWLIPRKDMVQLPVLSLPRHWWQFTAAHYLDEFAQQHSKDLVVREALHRSLPAAGVGVAFSRRAMLALAQDSADGPFRLGSLTEDYDLGLRLRELGLRQIFARYWTTSERLRKHFFTGELRREPVRELVCVREYFPASLGAAVKQKARWVVGIALQGWRTWGWRGDWVTRYMFMRDRKVLVTSLAAIAGYPVLALITALWIWEGASIGSVGMITWEGPRGALWALLAANLVVLAMRVLQRALFTGLAYGPLEAMLSIPRMAWGTVVNALATLRALRLWWRYLKSGEPIGWDKTAHQFPIEPVAVQPNIAAGKANQPSRR